MIKDEIVPHFLDTPGIDHEQIHKVGADKIELLLYRHLTHIVLQIPLNSNGKPSSNTGSTLRK